MKPLPRRSIMIPLSTASKLSWLVRPTQLFLLLFTGLLLLSAINPVRRQSPPTELLTRKGFTEEIQITGEPWVRRGGGMQASGAERRISSRMHVGQGDFEMRARLTFEDVESSGALFELGANVFCFASRKDKNALFVRGPDLSPKGAKKLVLPGTKGRTPEKTTFDFVVRRDAETIRILFDGELVHSLDGSEGPLGQFGFQPRRALMRIHSWTFTGKFMDPLNNGTALRKLQPAINQAIDKGVVFLIKNQLRDGSWAYEAGRYRNGQTALCMYTLLKCGVKPEHGSVQRARAFLESYPPRETYALACQMMAFEATKDPALKPRIGELLDQLLEWQAGGWSYPWSHPMSDWHEKKGLIDLSNTQYAALGLRAATYAGHEVPDRAWKQLLRNTLTHQEASKKVEATTAKGRSSTGKREIAGFGYRPGHGATGSMTTAGISIVELCRQGLGGKAGGSDLRKMNKSRDLALGWLDHKFSVVENPGGGWIFYYLYGLERVGGLLGIDTIGSHAWYYEGARRLVKIQAENGTWTNDNVEADTCFSLLFLKRATARSTGGAAQAPRDLYISEAHDAEVRFRASGSNQLTVWITGISDDVREDYGVKRGSRTELYLQRVEYWLDDKLVATVECDPRSAWKGEGHATRITLDEQGQHRLSVRVTIALPKDADSVQVEPDVVEGDELSFDVDGGLSSWMLFIAEQSGSTVIADHQGKATATCSAAAHYDASKAIDGLLTTAWLCKSNEGKATFRLNFKKPVAARQLVLQQAASRQQDRYAFDVVRSVELRFPGAKVPPMQIELPANAFVPAIIDLPEGLSLRQLEIEVLETEDGGSSRGESGFAEIGIIEAL